MAGEPEWESVWQAAAATDRAGALALVAAAIVVVLVALVVGVLWTRTTAAHRPARPPHTAKVTDRIPTAARLN